MRNSVPILPKDVLLGRRAIISGASQGFGRELARTFLAAGADVAICARTSADIETAAATLRAEFPLRRIVALAVDVAQVEQLDAFYAAVRAELGGADIVVNNAGIHGPIGPFEETDWDAWVRAVSVNLLGTVYSCRCAVREFKSQQQSDRRRKIINISGGGATAPQPGLTAYGASKAGLVRFTETLAEEVRAFAIDVNAVAPGALATRLMDELKAAGPEKIGAKYHARVEELHAQGGMSPSRAAKLCIYLASPASDGVTGRLIAAAWDPWPFSADVTKDLKANDIYTLRRITPEDRGRRWSAHS